jgi:hypothetical protein
MSCAPPSVACDDRRREEHSPQPLGKAFLTWKAFKNFAVTNPESADALVCTDTSICAADAHKLMRTRARVVAS